MPMKLLGGWL